MFRFMLISCGALIAVGCTHTQLRMSTVSQAESVHDVYTQQVLDNVARFVHNRNALPHFSVAKESGANVTDGVTGSGGLEFDPYRITGWMLGGEASRQNFLSYTLDPINDPCKLELMRCAYQRAVGSCTGVGENLNCPNCDRRFNNFYLGTETPDDVEKLSWDGKVIWNYISADGSVHEVYADKNRLGEEILRSVETNVEMAWNADQIKKMKRGKAPEERLEVAKIPNTVVEHTNRSGRVTIACLSGCCWFETGTKWECCRNRCKCDPCGSYCGTYVWVPECGRDMLTKLTLTILDIALNEAPIEIPPQKEVTVWVDSTGRSTTKDKASYEIKSVIPFATSPGSLLPSPDEVDNEDSSTERSNPRTPELPREQVPSEFIQPLSRDYYGEGTLQLQQRLRTNSPAGSIR